MKDSIKRDQNELGHYDERENLRTKCKDSYFVDERGFYGEFGGAYVPEILYKCVHDLQKAYLPIIESE